jgi:chromosome segregation ATPase
MTRALARAHKATARVSLSRDKWLARALEAQDSLAWDDAQDEMNPSDAVTKEYLQAQNKALCAVAEGLKRERDEARRDLSTALAAEQRRHEESDAAGKEVTRLAAKVADLSSVQDKLGRMYNAELGRREDAEAHAKTVRAERDATVKRAEAAEAAYKIASDDKVIFKAERNEARERAEALEKQLAAANEERDNLKARLSLAGSDTLRGVKFELARLASLGTQPPSKMLADVLRILALIPGDA